MRIKLPCEAFVSVLGVCVCVVCARVCVRVRACVACMRALVYVVFVFVFVCLFVCSLVPLECGFGVHKHSIYTPVRFGSQSLTQ